MRLESFSSPVGSGVLLVEVKCVGCRCRFPKVVLQAQGFRLSSTAFLIVVNHRQELLPQFWFHAEFDMDTKRRSRFHLDDWLIFTTATALIELNDGVGDEWQGVAKVFPLAKVWRRAMKVKVALGPVLFVKMIHDTTILIVILLFRSIIIIIILQSHHKLKCPGFGLHGFLSVGLDHCQKLGAPLGFHRHSDI